MTQPSPARPELSARASVGLWVPAFAGVVVGVLLLDLGGQVRLLLGGVLLVLGLVTTIFAAGARLVVVGGRLHQRVLWLPGERGWLRPVDLRRLVSVRGRREGRGRFGSLVLTVRDANGVQRDVHLAAWFPARRLRRLIARYAKQCRVPVRQS